MIGGQLQSSEFGLQLRSFMVVNVATNRYGVAKLIVAPTLAEGANYTTIAAALTAASSGDTIFIRPGTYTENPTMKGGVNLCTFECDSETPNVTIVGKCTHNTAGTVTCSGIRFQTNSDYCIVNSGSAASILNLLDCYINAPNSSAINYTSSNSSAQINLIRCHGDLATTGIKFFDQTSPGVLNAIYSPLTNSGLSTTASTASAGITRFLFSLVNFPVTTSSTNTFEGNFSRFDTSSLAVTCLTIGGSGNNTLKLCELNSFSASSISIGSSLAAYHNNINSTGSNVVTGAGTYYYAGNVYGNNATPNTTTRTPEYLDAGTIIVQGGPYITSGSGSPNGVITAPKGSIYMRTDGSSSSTRAYSNTNGGTTWTAFTTVA